MSEDSPKPDNSEILPEKEPSWEDEEDRLWAESLREQDAASQERPVSPPPSLDDLAAEIVQLEAEDREDVLRLAADLRRLADDPSTPSQARTFVAQAADKVKMLSKISAAAGRKALMDEIGLFMDAAADMMEAAPDCGPPDVPVLPQHDEVAARESSEPRFQEIPDDADPELMREFISEGSEAIDAAEAALLDLENNPHHMEGINTVFRSFHTIKGTSAFLGLDQMSHLAHLAENLFQRIRDGEVLCAGGFADLSLRSVDVLDKLMKNVQAGLQQGDPIPLPGDFQSLCEVLRDPEARGVCCEVEDDVVAPPPRLGDILVSRGAVTREDVEQIEASRGDQPLGIALVRSRKAKAADVAKALRSQKTRGSSQDSSVRVRTNRLDRLIDLVGELVIAQSMVAQDDVVLARENHEMTRKVNHAGKIIRELQDLSLSMRMVPLKPTFQKMARLVRDLSRKGGKQIEFVTAGEDTEIDRNMVDIIGDPLVHMVRNACDHGLESPQERQKAGKEATGTVSLSAHHAGGNVIVELRDDGRGLNRGKILEKALSQGLIHSGDDLSDPEVLALIFAPGFSTADEITDVSGRGVGMDVVRRNIESIRGRIQIESRPGRGSTFTIILPLTLAITDGMLIQVGRERFIIPTVNIHMSLRPELEALSTVSGRGEMVLLRGDLMPLYRLDRIFEVAEAQQDPTQAILVIVGEGHNHCALMVDDLLGQQQVVAKSLGGGIGQVPGISGGAILGDGRVGLIIDTAGLMELGRCLPASGTEKRWHPRSWDSGGDGHVKDLTA